MGIDAAGCAISTVSTSAANGNAQRSTRACGRLGRHLRTLCSRCLRLVACQSVFQQAATRDFISQCICAQNWFWNSRANNVAELNRAKCAMWRWSYKSPHRCVLQRCVMIAKASSAQTLQVAQADARRLPRSVKQCTLPYPVRASSNQLRWNQTLPRPNG